MACMCGDVLCPSCGPAQGYHPQFEALCDTLGDRLGAFFDGIPLSPKEQQKIFEMILEKVADILAEQDQQVDADIARQMVEDEKAYQDWLIGQHG
jgi:hypothetical protein